MIVKDPKHPHRFLLLSKNKKRVLAKGSKKDLMKREKQIIFFKNLEKRRKQGKRPFVPLKSKKLRERFIKRGQ